MAHFMSLYGRERDLDALRAALDDAFLGRGRLALVSGDAGIGKSALASAVAGEAEKRGASVTWGRAWEFADAPPWFPLWPCFRTLGIAFADTHDDASAFRLWESVAVALAKSTGPFV